MCDTVVALGNATRDGSILFAKNSDRDPNEAHIVEIVPAANHAPGSLVKCTYIEIPQVEHTNRVLLAKPFWIWGAEMGANEHGVVIGNEAVFTRIPPGKEPGLIGMDFLRLALERADNASAAMKVIIALLEQYGQSGNCGFSHPFYYDNSYLIADRCDAWVLETAGRQWAAEKVASIRSISNGLTIGSRWDMASTDLVDYAVDQGWCKDRSTFDFAHCYSDFLYTRFSDSRNRQVCTTRLLNQASGQVEPGSMMRLLRSHGVVSSEGWTPDKAVTGAQVCMHAGFGPIRINQTTGSMVSHIAQDIVTHWVTATSAPCTSLFKPLWLDGESPRIGPLPGGTYDPESLFWQHELLHRETLKDYNRRLKIYSAERDSIEQDWLNKLAQPAGMSRQVRTDFSHQAFHQGQDLEQQWLQRIRLQPVKSPAALYYRLAWGKFNRDANLQV